MGGGGGRVGVLSLWESRCGDGVLPERGAVTLVQYAARLSPFPFFSVLPCGGRGGEGRGGTQFDSDYSGGDDASIFLFFR